MNEMTLFLTLSAVFLQSSANTIPPIVTERAMNATAEDIGSETDRKDFEPVMNSAESHCPPGFYYLPNARTCYQMIFDTRRTWSAASQSCQNLLFGAHLAIITSVEETTDVAAFIRQMVSQNPRMVCNDRTWTSGNIFWIGGQRIRVGDCSSAFVWKLPNRQQLPMNYINWDHREPNCGNGLESCAHIYEASWNDIKCDAEMCALCEYNLSTKDLMH